MEIDRQFENKIKVTLNRLGFKDDDNLDKLKIKSKIKSWCFKTNKIKINKDSEYNYTGVAVQMDGQINFYSEFNHVSQSSDIDCKDIESDCLNYFFWVVNEKKKK
jgi:hypothetical protein